MHIKNLTIVQDRFPAVDAYPFNLTLLQKTKSLDLDSPTIFFTGENGTGKSTLLKALCRRCGIHIWEGAYRTHYQKNPYQETLHRALDVTWNDIRVPGMFFSPELFRNFSQLVDEWADSSPEILQYYGGDSLVTQSHGQSCMAYFRSVFSRKGLYFLDEPEAALSPKTQLELLDFLMEAGSTGDAQFIISTHSPILMSCKAAKLYSFNRDVIEEVSFQETSHFKVYNRFFESFKNEE